MEYNQDTALVGVEDAGNWSACIYMSTRRSKGGHGARRGMGWPFERFPRLLLTDHLLAIISTPLI